MRSATRDSSARGALSAVSSTEAPAAPYPPDVSAKGWRFSLDYERIEQSDTWALSPPDMRPWLLMLWMTAWKQRPCGSLPALDELIAARIGMDLRHFRVHRDILLRGWILHADGRLYHRVITEQVLSYLENCRRESKRKAEWRAKQNQQLTPNVPRDKAGTDAGVTTPEPEPEPEPNTRLHLSPPTALPAREPAHTHEGRGLEPIPPAPVPTDPTAAGRACMALRQAGIGSLSPSHPKLLAFLSAGGTVDELLPLVPRALDAQDPFAYLLAAAIGERKRAAALEAAVAAGGMPPLRQAFPTPPAPENGPARRPGEADWAWRKRLRTREFLGMDSSLARTTPENVIEGDARVVPPSLGR